MQTLLTKTQKKNWIKALLSGEYAQTTGRLKTEQGYCCLGVFCAINGKRIRKPSPKDADNINLYRWVEGLLGGKAEEVSEDNDKSRYVTLSTMNDIQGKSFKYIASWINKHIKTK